MVLPCIQIQGTISKQRGCSANVIFFGEANDPNILPPAFSLKNDERRTSSKCTNINYFLFSSKEHSSDYRTQQEAVSLNCLSSATWILPFHIALLRTKRLDKPRSDIQVATKHKQEDNYLK